VWAHTLLDAAILPVMDVGLEKKALLSRSRDIAVLDVAIPLQHVAVAEVCHFTDFDGHIEIHNRANSSAKRAGVPM
jgi:hypothetical protein